MHKILKNCHNPSRRLNKRALRELSKSISLLAICLLLLNCTLVPLEETTHDTVYAPTETRSNKASHLDAIARHTNTTSFMILNRDTDALAARITLIRQANHNINLKTFIFKDDLIGALTLSALEAAANRGVKIRLLLDDLHLGEQDEKLAAYDAHPNIEVRLFNPVIRNHLKNSQQETRFGPPTRRMYNNALIVDKNLAIVGDRNITKEHFERSKKSRFTQIDALVTGPSVKHISTTFALFWDHQLSFPMTDLVQYPPNEKHAVKIRLRTDNFIANQSHSNHVKAIQDKELTNLLIEKKMDFFSGEVMVFFDSAENFKSEDDPRINNIPQEAWQHFDKVSNEILIVTPYLLAENKEIQSLAQLRRQGKNVRILTNSLASSDRPLLHARYVQHRRTLLEAGIKIYELKASPKPSKKTGKFLLHFHMFDRKNIVFSSPTLDSALRPNTTKTNTVIESPKLGNKIYEWFESEAMKNAYEVELIEKNNGKKVLNWKSKDGTRLAKEPDTSLSKRILNGLYRVFPGNSSK